MAQRPREGHGGLMQTKREISGGSVVPAEESVAFDEALRAAVGYRIVAREGDAGVITGVPEAGRPPRPLLLVVRAGNTFCFVSRRRVERVLPRERRVVIGSGNGCVARCWWARWRRTIVAN
jgi:hypothetical protein